MNKQYTYLTRTQRQELVALYRLQVYTLFPLTMKQDVYFLPFLPSFSKCIYSFHVVVDRSIAVFSDYDNKSDIS